MPRPRWTALAAALLLAPAAVLAQGSDAPNSGSFGDPMSVVRRLFDAMRARDTAAFRAQFLPGAMLGRVVTKDGVGTFTADEKGIEGFIAALGRPSPAAWDERIANPVVRIDGDLAMVWVDFTFYLGNQKSHCGVDAFQMVRGADGWKIFTLVDTSRRDSCPDLAPGS